jgi:P4 family phage/plasmid primase-like protien
VHFVCALFNEPIICRKRGKKGLTIVVQAEPDIKAKKLRVAGEPSPAIEFLCVGNQTVMPPSIHPETGEPYLYVDCKPLYEHAPAELNLFTAQHMDLLQAVLKSESTPIILGGSGTHDATLQLTAQLVAKGFPKETLLTSLPALFPADYAGNTLSELEGMIDSAKEKGYKMPHNSKAIDTIAARSVINAKSPLVFTDDEFLHYQDGYWSTVDKMSIETAALRHLDNCIEKGAVAPYIRHTVECIKRFCHEPEFGTMGNLICCRNGTVDVRTGELLPHSPEHQLRYRVDMDYDPQATCPTYDAHLERVFVGDTEAGILFNEFCGYTLVPDNRFQKALYLIGAAGSGKSSLLSTLMSLHDPKAVSVTPLQKIDSERHVTDLAKKLLCVSMDIQPKDKSTVFGEAFVRITGGDPVTTRRLYKEVQGNVQATVRFIGSMNQLPPKFIAAPDALKRRLIFLTCGDTISNPDPDFIGKLKAERAGILNRWIRALQCLYARGHFIVPESSRNLVTEYLESHDPVQLFINERLILDPNAATRIEDIFLLYTGWAEANSEGRMSKSALGKSLQEHGLKQRFKKLAVPGRDQPVNTRIYNVQIVCGDGLPKIL